MRATQRLQPRRRVALLLLPLLAAACTDSTPLSPVPAPTLPTDAFAAMRCTVQVQSATMSCSEVDPAAGSGASLTRIFGGQNRNVKLANTNNSFDAGTLIFQIDVTVQNLTQQALGLDSLGNATGVRVFFTEPPPEPVTVANPSGQAFITAANQDYFFYNEVLQPNEISAPVTWQFNVPGAGASFSFVVLIQAAQPNEVAPFADKVWDGSTSTAWGEPTNWEGGVVPDSASSVLIPTGTLPNLPVLSADVQVTNLNVGTGSSLTLGGYTLTAWGNVDALGTITGGSLWMRGAGTLLGGNLPGVRISGGTALQRATHASGAVSINDGSLVVNGSAPLSISIP
jgi:hypothetical protein